MVLSSKVKLDGHIKYVSEKFDLTTDGTTEFEVPELSAPEEFSIGLIVGPSGTGKSTLLRKFGLEDNVEWESDLSIISHFDTPETGSRKLMSVGFNSVPSWIKPFHVLSNGEQHRAMLARSLKDHAVVDEFTSVVDRQVAKAMSVGTRRFIESEGLKNIVIATCHYDVEEWLRPDWTFNTATGELSVRRSVQPRPEITLDIYEDDKTSWEVFTKHHYLTGAINKASRQYVAYWEGQPVGFVSALSMPSGTLKKAWRGHRTVVLPDYQGLGIGKKLTEWIATKHIENGDRFFCKTTHPKLGEYRNKSLMWVGTSKNGKKRSHEAVHGVKNAGTRCVKSFSHEYMGKSLLGKHRVKNFDEYVDVVKDAGLKITLMFRGKEYTDTRQKFYKCFKGKIK